ncbi:MAG: response regulator [Phycisphaerae bacterium]|nr:response regulator [Phycisphaerae bacterium]NIR66885.1 response regulator [candidate division Zixibacteria bacterium]NIP51302.1 response regulator [Phycisphaerae bacterium]NIS54040.1 response regulator [Phycisphaerae bacterium]NIU11647.1 response regulator [Phycisphaerae bacterium]
MEKRKILIVDDDQDIRDSLQVILEGKRYDVITAANKNEGMEKIKSEKPDLIMLDVMMSSPFDGLDMSRQLKKDPKLENTPILMLTGIKGQTGIPLKSAAGDPDWCPVDAFLYKPVEPDTLLEEVEKLMAKKS